MNRLGLIVLLLVVASSSSFCLTYSVVEIPMVPHGWELWTYDINKSGRATGFCQCYDGYDYSQAFVYENGVTTPLDGLGGDSSGALAINEQGWIVGDADTGQYYYSEYYDDWFPVSHACLWRAGAVADLGTLGGYSSGASGVNNLGDIVGSSNTTAVDSQGRQISKPFIYTNGQMTDLNQLLPSGSGWVLTSAYAINDSRQISGAGKLNGISYCFFFDLGNGTITAVTNLTTPTVRLSHGLNNSGAVTGSVVSNYQLHGLLWSPSAGSTDIPALPGYYHSEANDINNANQAVGYSMDQSENYTAAFLFQCGALININSLVQTPGWSIRSARRISDAGSIIAYASASAMYTSSDVILVPEIDTTATAKATENDKPVSFRGIPVTAVFGDCFYVEPINRSSGIRVDCPGHSLQPGMAADVDGIIKTSEDGERYVDASHAVQNGEASVKPVGMPLKPLGGGAWKTGTGGSGQAGVTGGAGLNNIGLLVRTWGTLYQGADEVFCLEDGSGPKLLLETPAGFSQPLGQMAQLDGIVSCSKDTSGNVHRLLKVTAVGH